LGHAAATTREEARKICLERYDVEKAGGTLPARMDKSRYVNQCTLSILRSAKLEAELKASQQDQAQPQTGGANETTPDKNAATPAQTTSRPH
jgi:hypothetical protein